MPEWIFHGMPSVIALMFVARWIVIGRRKNKLAKRRIRSTNSEAAIFEQLTFEQIRKWQRADRIDFEATAGGVLRIADSTPIKGFSVSLPKPHIPRGSLSVTMCNGNSVIVCLSVNRRTLMLQRKDVDDRYLLYFLEAATDRTLEEIYSIVSASAMEEPVCFHHRQHHRSLIGNVTTKNALSTALSS